MRDLTYTAGTTLLVDHLRLFLRTIGKDHHSASVPQSSNTFPHLWKNTLGHGSIPASARLPRSARARRRCRRLRRRRPYTATWLHFYGRRDSATPSGLSPSELEDVPVKSSKVRLGGLKSGPNKVQKRKETNVNVWPMLEKSKLLFLCIKSVSNSMSLSFMFYLRYIPRHIHGRRQAGSSLVERECT